MVILKTRGMDDDPGDPIPGRIPLPDYNNPESRLAYAKAFRNKYGQSLVGHGDIPLRVNEKPAYGSDTSKNIATKAARAVGLDPALLYASSMIEGQEGLYPGYKPGMSTVGVRYTGNHDYPVSGLWHFGLDSFKDYYPTLKKKGYLPQDFDKNFTTWEGEGGPAGPQYPESTMFKNAESGVQAKAAMMRAFYDELDDYAKSKKINLTPDQRNFFALAHFNSGAHGYQMLDAYNKAGLLKGDDFMNKMPDIPIAGVSPKLHKQIYDNVIPRIMAARGLKSEGLFGDEEAQDNKDASKQVVLKLKNK